MKHYQKKDGSIITTRTQKYVCQQRKKGIPCKCTGQHTYLAEKLEDLVIVELTSYLEKIWEKEPHVLAEARVYDKTCELEKSIEASDNKRQELEREMHILRSELFASMEGNSKFTTEQIQQLYTQCQKELIEIKNQIALLNVGQADLRHKIWEKETVIKTNQERWKEFKSATLKRRKYLLSFFLSRVVVKSGYEIRIDYYQLK